MKNLSKVSVIATLLLPSFAFASTNFMGLMMNLQGLLNMAVPLLIGLAVVYFLWGVFMYIKAGADEGGKADAKKNIVNGIIGLFVMVAVWGIVGVIASSLSIDTGGVITAPQLP